MTPGEFLWYEKTLGESAPAYSTTAKWHAELKGGDRRVMTCTDVDDRQLLSTKKLLKKSTILS